MIIPINAERLFNKFHSFYMKYFLKNNVRNGIPLT